MKSFFGIPSRRVIKGEGHREEKLRKEETLLQSIICEVAIIQQAELAHDHTDGGSSDKFTASAEK